MIHNRKTLLAFLREKCGFDGAEELATVEKFITDAQLDLVDEADNAIDIKALWAKTDKRKVSVKGTEVDAGEGEGDEDETRLQGKRRVQIGNKAASVDSALAKIGTGSRRSDEVAKKAYAAKAARGETVFSDADEAEAMGAWMRRSIASIAGVDYAKAASDEAIIAKTSLTTNTSGSALIPEDLSTQIIALRESAAGPERFCSVETMSRDVQGFPRETGGTTIYAPGEGGSTTASDMTHDNVKLVASKLAGLSKVSSELLNDSPVSFAERLSNRMAYDMRRAEERDAIQGDGTSTYHGFVGLAKKAQRELEAAGYTWTTDAEKAYHPGLVVAAGNTFAEVTKANLLQVVGQVEQYDDTGEEPFWLISKPAYWQIGQALGYGVGGVTATEWINGVQQDRLLGHRVVFTPYLPKVDANSQVICSFGYHNLGMKVGRVRGSMSIARSEHVGFVDDVIYFRITSRVAINVHDLGTLHATATSRVNGPIVALVSTNS